MDFKKEWLQWVIDFIQTDISKLIDRTEEYNFFRRFYQFTSFRLFYAISDPSKIQLSKNQILEFHTSALKIQTALKQFIDQLITTRANHPLPDFKASILPGGPRPPLPKGEYSYFKLRFLPKENIPESWAFINLAKLLDGIEVGSIGKCQECQRYFLNLSHKVKKFCSHNCGAKFLFRSRKERWRPERFDAYRKKQREVMKKRHMEKRKKEGKPYRPRPKERGSKKIPAIF